MQNGQYTNKQKTEETVNLWHFARALWKRLWLILLVTVLCGAIALCCSKTLIAPTYRSSFTTYVNNKMEIDNMGSTSVSDLNASYGLAYVYQEIITSRSVVEEAVALCKLNGTYPQGEDARYSITATVVEKAPIITVYVEAENAAFARDLARAIAEAAPGHVERVVEGSSMHIIDEATLPDKPSSPNNLQNTLLGAAVGFFIVCLALIAVEFYMDKVQDAEDLEKRYEIPVLGTIPNLDRNRKASKNSAVAGGNGR